MSLKVEPKHVKEAYRLLSCSILKLEKPNVELTDEIEDLNGGVNRINIGNEKLDEHKRKREEEKKSKLLSISHELYQSIKKDVE